MVEDGPHFGLEHVPGVRVRRQVVVQHVGDRQPYVGGGGGPPAPVQDELVVQQAQQVLGAGLDQLAFVGGQLGLGLGEHVEDSQLLFGQPLGDGALLLTRQGPAQLDEAAQVLVDVDAARVVLGDQLLDPFDELIPGRVAGGGAPCPLAQEGREAVGLGPLAAGERCREGLEVDLGEVDERVGLAALGGGADDVLLCPDGAVSNSSTASTTRFRSAVGGCDTWARRSPSSRIVATVCCCAAAAGSGSSALNSARACRAAARKDVRVSSSTRSSSTAASRMATYAKPDASRRASRSTLLAAQRLTALVTASPRAATRASTSWIGESTPVSALADP